MCVLCKEMQRFGDEDVLTYVKEPCLRIDTAMCVQAVDQGC